MVRRPWRNGGVPLVGRPRKFGCGYGVLAIFIVALVAGVRSVVALLAPYSSYGRIATNLFALLWRWGNNLLAWFAERAGNYAFYSTEVWLRSLPTFIIAAVTFVVLAMLAWRNGRTYYQYDLSRGDGVGASSRVIRCFVRSSIPRSATVARCVRADARRVHRCGESHDRLFALRRLHGLHRHLRSVPSAINGVKGRHARTGTRCR